jgi:hypothetical protein
MGTLRNASKILVKNLKVRDHLGDLGVDWRIILKWIFVPPKRYVPTSPQGVTIQKINIDICNLVYKMKGKQISSRQTS